MTHQGPGKERRACPGKEAAGEVLRRCEGQLEGRVGVGGGTVLCGHKYEKDNINSLNAIWISPDTLK